MWRGTPTSIALTVDDAPSVCEPGGPDFDPGRMDRIREALLAAGVRDCVAFVIGSRAHGQDGCLRRWLDAGFELGNHTEDHRAASSVDPGRFLESVRACDQRLLDVGAFEGGRRRFLRHPFGDRGPAGPRRLEIAAGIAELGYTPAEITVDLYDWAYDPRWVEAHAQRRAGTGRVEARFIQVAARSLRCAGARGRRLWGSDLIHVAACHFGPVTERCFSEVARQVGARVRWAALSDATDVPRYRRLVADMERDCQPSDLRSRGLASRALRRTARVLDQRSNLGPRWPHLWL